MLKKSLLIAGVVLFTGCATQNNPSAVQTKEPQWLMDPYYQNDNIAAIGCAAQHFKGEEAQKDLAISRAIDRIATQHKVTVNNVTLRQRSISDMGKSSSSSSQSLHSVDKVSISTRVKDIFKKSNGDICAWVVQK
jgi:hypothetical protein